jgi:outer membrane protein OmpA-like peptidoglycan-associated protein
MAERAGPASEPPAAAPKQVSVMEPASAQQAPAPAGTHEPVSFRRVGLASPPPPRSTLPSSALRPPVLVTPPTLHPAPAPAILRIPVRERSPRILQPKLEVRAPNDRFEQEADRVAAEVTRMPAPVAQVQRMCAECEGEDPEGTIQRSPALRTGDGPRPPRAIERPAGTGTALPAEVRGFMEPRFGYDFTGVRIHADHDMAPLLRARAFTIGSDIYFAPGEFQPHTSNGRYLLGHELTHTIQQGAVPALDAGHGERSSLAGSIGRTSPAIQREVGESSVASSSQVLARIEARLAVADAHAATIVRVMRSLRSLIPSSMTQLRDLIANEPLFNAGMTNLVRLIELGLEFNPGAGRDSPQNSFVYTCRRGWIDMGHFFISAAMAYVAGFLLRMVNGLRDLLGTGSASQASLIIGWQMEHLQEAFRQFATGPFGGLLDQAPAVVREAVMGNVRSAFTVEDLPSDAFGAELGQEIFGSWALAFAGMGIDDPEPFDIRGRMAEFFTDHVAVFPTGQTRRAMVEETIGPGPLPRQHFSTTPVLLTSAVGLCPVPETACPAVDERGWERSNPAGRIEEASDRTTLWNFAVDEANLKAEHQQRLRQGAAAAPSRAMIMVEGFASCSGSAAHNERLARSRAEAVAAFLRAQRPDLRVGMNYFGERTPRHEVTAGNGEAMAKNRRVEIYLVVVDRTTLGIPRLRLPTKAPLPMPATGAASATSTATGEEDASTSSGMGAP